jgi:tetrahydromethanopterin S-methyltransferase subunit C
VKGWLPLAIGIVAVVVGAVWTVQGLGYLSGSVMTDERIWAVIGPLVAVAGLVSIAFALRIRRR